MDSPQSVGVSLDGLESVDEGSHLSIKISL